MQFWIAQFVMEVGRWISRAPAPDGTLQAVLMFDEADLYLPAVRQPASKEPMEHLLRRRGPPGWVCCWQPRVLAISTTVAAITSAPGSSARSRRRTRWPR